MKQISITTDSLQIPCRHAVTRIDREKGIAWYYMDPKPRSCITMELLEDYKVCRDLWEKANKDAIAEGKEPPVRYVVHASYVPHVYNYGGDLERIISCIHNKDREGLREYARKCIEVVHLISVNGGQPLTTIGLVRGDALGGGFEAALACNTIIAEKQAQFGLPEILFNLFPGMGAYSILSRKVGSVQAEKIITSGSMYSASEMHEMGIIDVLTEEGTGEQAVYDYVSRHARKRNSLQSILQVRQRVNPVPWKELVDISEIWVDTAMNIGGKELRVMERLVRAQVKQRNESEETASFQKIRA